MKTPLHSRTWSLILISAACLAFPGSVQSQETDPNPFGQTFSSDSTEDQDPFELSDSDESESEKQERINRSQQATIKNLNRQIDSLNNEVRKANAREQFAFDMTLESIRPMLWHRDASIQSMGLKLLESLLERADREKLTSHYEKQLLRFCVANLKAPLESDVPEVRSATIGLLERFSAAGGIQFGFQPLTGYWHPVNDVIGTNAELRRELAIKGLVYGRHDDSLRYFLEEIETAMDVVFVHDHDVDLETTKVELDLVDATAFELLDVALGKLGLGYAVVNGKIEVRSKGSPELAVTQIFNVRGLLTSNTDITRILALVKQGMQPDKLELIVEYDQYRLMVQGTEPQLRKVSRLLGLLAGVAESSPTRSSDASNARGSTTGDTTSISAEGQGLDPEAVPAQWRQAVSACNQILAAIQSSDTSTLASWCRPKYQPKTEADRQEFARMVGKMKDSLRTRRTSIIELRQGRSQNEWVGLVEVNRGEAILIVIQRPPLEEADKEAHKNGPESTKPGKGYYFVDLNSPLEEHYRTLDLILALP